MGEYFIDVVLHLLMFHHVYIIHYIDNILFAFSNDRAPCHYLYDIIPCQQLYENKIIWLLLAGLQIFTDKIQTLLSYEYLGILECTIVQTWKNLSLSKRSQNT